MFALIDLQQLLQLLDLGTAIAMLVVFIRMYKGKDKQHENLHSETNKRLTELLIEVTKALTDKNHTDENMAKGFDAERRYLHRLLFTDNISLE